MTLHPQAAAHLAATADVPGVSAGDVAAARLGAYGFLDLQRPAPAMAEVVNRFIPGPTADLPIRILRPEGAVQGGPVIIVLHGSGWVIANLDIADEPARVLAADTGAVVITVNYQKAPEHPYPVPLDDALAAVRWVYAHAAELNVDPSRIAVVGDSAGGNLTAVATAELVAEGVPIAAQALLYPVTDVAQDSASYAAFATGYGLSAADMAWFWGHYLPSGVDGSDPHISPLRATSFAGLPPTFVATAEYDVLRDEGEAYAAALARDGAAVEAIRYPGMIHGFWWMDGVLDPTRDLQLDLARFLVEHLRMARPIAG